MGENVSDDTNLKCREIIEAIIDRVNGHRKISFTDDWGGNTLTVEDLPSEEAVLIHRAGESGPPAAGSHTHCGVPDGEFDLLVKNLHAALTGKGPHLSWA